MEDKGLALKKKPVRRATAKTAPAPAPAAKGRATRSRKVEVEDEQDDELAGAQKTEEEVAETPKTTMTRATRSRRGETAEPEPETRPAKAASSTQAKRPARTRSTRAAEAAPEKSKAPAPQAKPALAARPTRQTRAKTPVPQTTTSPLSPKKITQVSRVRTRSTKSAQDEKPKLAPSSRAAPVASRTTRKRTVSDENAEVPELMARRSPDCEVIEELSAAPKAPSPRKTSPAKENKEQDDETPMSSRETIPSDSPAPTFEQPKNYTEDHLDAPSADNTEDEAEAEEQSASDDELCGPKTPMRRSHRTDQRFYTSPQRTARRSDPRVPEQTPPRRIGADGAMQPTPQTLAPRSQAAVPLSAVEPMTVSRAADRAFVFRPLEREKAESAELDGPDDAEEEMPGDDDETEESDAAQNDVEDASGASEDEVHLPDGDAASETSAVDPNETIVVDEDETSNVGESEVVDSPTVQPPVASYEEDDSMVDVDSSMVEPPVASYDPEDSILEADSPTAEPPVPAYEFDEDDSVMMHEVEEDDTQIASDHEDDDDAPDATMFGLQTPRHQTIPWQNLRDDNTIPVDFDLHFADVRSPTRIDAEVPFAGEDIVSEPQAGYTDADFEMDTQTGGYAAEPTMTLNDFIDVNALAEPTMQADAFAGAEDEVIDVEQAEAEPVEAADQQDDTVIITRPEASLSSPVTPRDSEPVQAVATPPQHVDDVLEVVDDELVPHYALPTVSSRRKSLPALCNQTPVRSASRPTTSDGASIARIARPFDEPWWSRSRRSSMAEPANSATPSRKHSTPASKGTPKTVDQIPSSPLAIKTPAFTPAKRLARTAHGSEANSQAQTVAAPVRFRTPAPSSVKHAATIQRLPSQQHELESKRVATPTSARRPSGHEGPSEQKSTSVVPLRLRTPTSTRTARTPSTSATPLAETTPVATPKERFPRRSARQPAANHASTVAAPARFHTPIQGKPKRPATAQRLASQNGTPKAQSATVTPTRRPGAASQETARRTPSPVKPSAAVTPQARYPRLPPRQAYEQHASTVVGPSRFRSPAHASPKRPATSQKPVNLRKMALKSSAPGGSHTPIKTPLKPAAMTPSQVPMTPHPGAPLRGVVALVEVFTLDGASASAPFISLLQRLGARTTKSWSERVTHVIFKDGSPTTLQRVRLNNKEVTATGKGFAIHCVNSRWVSDCDASGSRVDEDDDAYAVDLTDVPRGGGRRRKSMEPAALVNIGGNIVRDRKSSGGGRSSIGPRASLGRSAMKLGSSAEKEKDADDTVPFTPGVGAKLEGLEDDFDFEEDESELSTPDYLAAPDKLVQMTAPMNRVRKLELKGEEGKNRRLTFWKGNA